MQVTQEHKKCNTESDQSRKDKGHHSIAYVRLILQN